MVDHAARRRLAECLRHVVTGQISKDEFCATAETIIGDSKDGGLHAIWDDVDAQHDDVFMLRDFRFRGPFRLSPEMRHRIAIAVLFLYSNAEYKWPSPSWPRVGSLDCLLACACAVFVLAGAMLLAISIITLWFAVAAEGCFAAAVLLYRLSHHLAERFQAKWRDQQSQFGDLDVWPFLRREDFDEARRNPPLLCGHP